MRGGRAGRGDSGGKRRSAIAQAFMPGDNYPERRIASSSNAPERAKRCLIRMLPSPRHFVNLRPVELDLRLHRSGFEVEPWGCRRTTQCQLGTRSHRRARSSASPPVPPGYSIVSSLGLKYPGGLGAEPPSFRPVRGHSGPDSRRSAGLRPALAPPSARATKVMAGTGQSPR
jgi:hypothetical protein